MFLFSLFGLVTMLCVSLQVLGVLDRGCVYGFVLVSVESKRSNLWFEFGWGFYRGSRLSIGVGFSFNGE